MRCECGAKFRRRDYDVCPECGEDVPARSVNTGGGAYIEGNVTVGGDVVGGDLVLGDKVVVQRIARVDGPAVKIVLD